MRSGKMKILRGALLTAALVLFSSSIWIPSLAGQGKPMPDGPGKEETQKICSACHDLEKSLSLRQDRSGWQQTLEKMLGFGAKATDQERDAVINYLVKNFPAEDVPKININKATAVELESGLSLKRSQATAIIQYRTQNGNFKTIEDLKKVPGVDLEKIEAKKDRIVFEE
jgi:competence protein ComEA